MSEREEMSVTSRIVESHQARSFFVWLGTIGGIIVLGIVGYAIYLVRQYVPIVGYIWLAALGILPTLGIVFLVIWIVRYLMQADVIEIGPTGTIVKWFNQVTRIHPLGTQEYKIREVKEQKQIEKPQVPLLLNVLREGVLGGIDLLLGYHQDGTARWGTWDDIRTFVVAGKSRSGKTVTMVFFIIQALMGNAQVWVCDIHHNKPTGLLKVLAPLIPYMRVARTHEEIVQLATDFKNEMNARENGTSEIGLTPILLVIDEWTKTLRDLSPDEVSLLVDTVLDCAEAWANFEGYAMVAGHEWTARESGGKKGAAVRRGFHSAFVHRIDEEYAKFLLTGAKGKKAAKTAPNLPTGHVHFQDSEGELDYLLIPYYGKQKEAIYEVVGMLPSPSTTTQPTLPTTGYVPSYLARDPIREQIAPPSLTSLYTSTPLPVYPSRGTSHENEREIAQKSVEVSSGRNVEGLTDESLRIALRVVGKRLKSGESASDIKKSLGIDGGRALQEINAVIGMIENGSL